MISFPNAKINLGLRITAKRPDGYHDLETVFYPIGLSDALEVVPSTDKQAYKLLVSGLSAEDQGMTSEKNIVTKAFRLLEKKHALNPVTFYLKKAIPSGAGLGGGSSDAAFALKMLNEFNQLHLTEDHLEEYSAQIGADCAFFIKNNPIFASGIGTDFRPIQCNLSGLYLILVKPDIHVSTAEAYSMVKPAQPETSLMNLIESPVENWKNTIINDFEPSVFNRYPLIGAIKEELYARGAVYASMSGSGSSVFGLFHSPVDLKEHFSNCFYWSEILK